MSCEGRQIYELVFAVRGLFSSALLTISESIYALLLLTLHRYSKAFSEILMVIACVRPVEGRPVPKAVPAFMFLEFSYVIIIIYSLPDVLCLLLLYLSELNDEVLGGI